MESNQPFNLERSSARITVSSCSEINEDFFESKVISNSKIYFCNHCSSNFSNSESLRRHLRKYQNQCIDRTRSLDG